MASHDYVFVTRWTVDGTPDEIYEVFVHAAGYCGFPASNGAVRLAVEVFKEHGLLKG